MITSEKKESYSLDEFVELGRDAFRKEYQKIKQNITTCKLGDICYISYGLRPNSDERYWKGEFTRDDLVSETKDNIHPKAYVEGKLIKRYSVEKIMYLEWGTDRVPKKLVRPTFPELYTRPKLMSGRVTGAIYDDTWLVCNDSIVVFLRFVDLAGVNNKSISGSLKKFNTLSRKELEDNSRNYDLKYLLAILNSRYANFYLNNHRRHRLENYFYPDDFRNLPIPVISREAQQPLTTLVDQILAAKQQPPSSPFIKGELSNADTSALEKQIDEMVYALYGLTPEEIAIVEGKKKL